MKKSHCKRGHDLQNAYLRKDGSRWCRTCGIMRNKKYTEKYKNASGPNSPPPENSIWKEIPDFPNYFASNSGYIKNNSTGELLKQGTRNCYLSVSAKNKNGDYKNLMVHRAVLITFAGLKPGLIVNHINNIKTDNRLENLEWVTYAENNLHARRIYGKDKITKELAKSIRKEHADLKKVSDKPTTILAKKYNVHTTTINNVVANRKHKLGSNYER